MAGYYSYSWVVAANGNTMAYDAGFVDVYLNGVRLDQTDYTATSGTSIVLASAAALNDELNIVAFGTFSVASINGVDIINGTVSANKLAAGAAVSNIGYTPVNKAGGEMTGALTLPNLGVGTTSDPSNANRTITYQNSGKNWYAGLRGDTSNSWALADDIGFRLVVDTSGRVTMPYQPGFKANKISNLQSISAGVWTRVAFNSVGGTSGFNTGSAYSTSTNRFTAPVAGKYIFTASVNISAGTGGVMYVDFGINGSNNAGAEVNVAYPSGDTSIGTSVIVNLAANDTVEVDLYTTTSTTAGNRICAFSGQLFS